MATPAESESISAPRRSPKRARWGRGGARWGRGALLAIALPSITLVILLVLWDRAVVHLQIPSTLLARPLDVLSELAYGLKSGILLTHTWVTLQEVFYGFLVGAFAGFAMGALVA